MGDSKRRDYVYDLSKVLQQMELELIQNMRRNMKRHEAEEEKEGFRWEMWQKAKLRNLWKYRRENKEIVGQYSPDVEHIVREALASEYERSENVFNHILSKLKALLQRRGVKYPKDISGRRMKPAPTENDFFGVNKKRLEVLQEEVEKVLPREPQNPQESEPFRPEGKEKDLQGANNDKKLDEMIGKVNNDLKGVQKAVWRSMDDVYRRVIYQAEMNMAAGVKTLDQAVDMATKSFLESGINCIEYKNGSRVNIVSYAEMALRTASQRAMLLGEGKKRDEWGIHMVVVSAHANTCPLCAPWQGKVLVDDVFSQGTKEEANRLGYALLSTAIKAGLLHPNCRHTISTFFPGVSVVPQVPDTEKVIETYNADQKQREFERKIRKWKRKAEGSLSPDNVNQANAKVKQYQRELRMHLDKHPELRREHNREKIRGVITSGHPKSTYGYENFDESHLAHKSTELLPNLENVDISDVKISGYVLNKTHPKGKDKAIAFEKYLGYNIDNKDELLQELHENLKKYKCSERAETKYGQPYEVAMVVKGANGKYARIKTGWIIDNGTDVPRLTTMYVDEG